MESINLYTGGAAIAVPLPVLLILSLPMAGQREELYSLKAATVPYRYAHPDSQLLLINSYFIKTSSRAYRETFNRLINS